MTEPLDPRDPRVQVVTAPAGSGKTTLLVYHYLRHLQRTDAERIAAITFTRKAAGELFARIARALRDFAEPPGASGRERLRALYPDLSLSPSLARLALERLPSAPLCTVDAFALSLVREFLLHAHFELSGAEKVYLDGPVEGGADTGPIFEAAARAQLDAMDRSAQILLRELSFGEAVRDVAMLARAAAPRSPSARQLAEQLAAALDGSFEQHRAAWSALAPAALPAAALASVHRWLERREGPPPAPFLAFVAAADEEPLATERAEAFNRVLGGHGFEPASPLRFGELVKGLRRWIDEEPLARADEVRAALASLAQGARDEALRAIARSGALGYDELLAAATSLCRRPPPALAARFDALMVDELQDTNPAQLAFYKAFASMREAAPQRPERAGAQLELFGPSEPNAALEPMATFFVGDGRQSIYRFRQADPYGWHSLVEKARAQGRWSELRVNYRSSALLVEAQRRTMAALAEAGFSGVERLDALAPAPEAPAGLLEGAGTDRPILVVDAPEAPEADAHALAEFARRLKARWERFPRETAAVLVRSWEQGARAAQLLRQCGVAAQVTGDRALLESRVAADLRQLLRALLDPSDEIALVGLLKHPSIGLSDASLLSLRRAGALSRLLSFEEERPGIAQSAGAEASAALATLQSAQARLGRESTAAILEQLVAALRWRPIIAASPEGADGSGVAQLDLLLELARQREASGVDPQAVADALAPGGDEGRADLPPAVARRGADRAVTVTTVFAAKGLEFDHVALLEVHKEGSSGERAGACARLHRRREQALLGVCLDPAGGLSRSADPIALVARALGEQESEAEGLRLFYVGLTRAAKSVTLGLKQPRRAPLVKPLREVLTGPELAGAVTVVAPDGAHLPNAAPQARERAIQRRAFAAQWTEGPGLTLGRPSNRDGLPPEVAESARALEEAAAIIQGRLSPALPELECLRATPESALGKLVHGWLERWGFRGEPSERAALDYLGERWRAAEPALASWLVALGLNLRDGLPGFGELLSHRLHFEWPLFGVVGETLWSGRSDLVVEKPGRELALVDFKAGSLLPVGGQVPRAREHFAQLAIYRRILEGAGYRVSEVGLVFARGASWVRVVAGAQVRAA